VVPSARIVAHGGKLPTVAPSAFVAPSASIVGQVNISEGAGIWYNAVVRGDQAKVSIGINSTVQERVVINATTPTSIGDNVVVGVGAQLSGCTLGNHTLVGVGASVQEGAVVESGAVVAAGSVVGKGLTIPAGQLWSGNPVAYLRDLTSAESLALANSGKWWCGWWWCGVVVVWCGGVWCGVGVPLSVSFVVLCVVRSHDGVAVRAVPLQSLFQLNNVEYRPHHAPSFSSSFPLSSLRSQ